MAADHADEPRIRDLAARVRAVFAASARKRFAARVGESAVLAWFTVACSAVARTFTRFRRFASPV